MKNPTELEESLTAISEIVQLIRTKTLTDRPESMENLTFWLKVYTDRVECYIARLK